MTAVAYVILVTEGWTVNLKVLAAQNPRMCRFGLSRKSQVAASMKQPVDNIENMASKEANKIVKEMQEEERYTQKKQ